MLRSQVEDPSTSSARTSTSSCAEGVLCPLYPSRRPSDKTETGWVVTFRPGKAFFQDYERFYRRRQQGELQWEFHADQREIARAAARRVPVRAAEDRPRTAYNPMSAQRRLRTPGSSSSTSHLRRCRTFLDFALAEAGKTHFDVQTLGGVRQYVDRYRAACEARKTAAVREAADRQREAEEAERAAYDAFRRREANLLFDRLPKEEQSAIEAAAGLKARSFNGSLGEAMRTRAIYALTVERHGDLIKSFEEWRSEH